MNLSTAYEYRVVKDAPPVMKSASGNEAFEQSPNRSARTLTLSMQLRTLSVLSPFEKSDKVIETTAQARQSVAEENVSSVLMS